MIYYIVLLLIYIGLLIFVRPAPKSFRDKKISIIENFFFVKGSLFIGIIILTIHLFVTNLTFLETNELLLKFFSLNNIKDNNFFVMQFFTHNFVHLNIVHLVGNLTVIGLLSAYERRVGLRRYIIVFFISGFVSSFSIFFYEKNTLTLGISGVVFGLSAAFFTDDKSLNFKDWMYAIFTFFILSFLLSFRESYELQNLGDTSFQINYISHILGAIGAITYTRLFKLK